MAPAMGMEWYLPLIWAALIGVAVALYVILDGFDLGVGILFPFARDEKDRDRMMNSVAPFWDGNETWLVLGGGGLWVAFPAAYAIIMPALYLPVIVMLLALVLRGVAFEFRWIAHGPSLWNIAFAGGSTLAAFSQGVILGGLIQGIKVEGGQFAGGTFDFATSFALLCGVGVTCGYALLGATWTAMKTEGATADHARRQARTLLPAVLILMGAVSLATPLIDARIAARWFSWPNIAYLAPVPLLTAAIAFAAWRWIGEKRDILPFVAVVALFLLGYFGLAVSSFPLLVPPSLTIWQAAAAPESQIFMLIGTLVMLPIILGYIVLVYWLFRGKVGDTGMYHH